MSISDSFKDFFDRQVHAAYWYRDNVEPIIDTLIGGLIGIIISTVRSGILAGLIVPALFFWLLTFSGEERVNLVHALNGQKVELSYIDIGSSSKITDAKALARTPIIEHHRTVSGEEYLSWVKGFLTRMFLVLFCLLFGTAQIKAMYRFFSSSSLRA